MAFGRVWHRHGRPSVALPLRRGIMRTRRSEDRFDREVSPRALAAIAEAARRSREEVVGPEASRDEPTQDRPVPESPTVQATTEPAAPPVIAPWPVPQSDRPAGRPAPARPDDGLRARTANPTDGPGGGRLGAGPMPDPAAYRPADGAGSPGPSVDRLLIRAIIMATVGLIAVLSALAASAVGTGGRGGVDSPTSVASGPAHAPAGPLSSTSSSGGAGGSGAGGSASTSSIAPAAPGSPPVLAALDPPGGPAGQIIVVSGSGFMSSSGQISAHFGAQEAGIDCPDQGTCTIVAPTTSGSLPSAPVTITTDSGTSNPLTFTYR
jgi:hypothetical protein